MGIKWVTQKIGHQVLDTQLKRMLIVQVLYSPSAP